MDTILNAIYIGYFITVLGVILMLLLENRNPVKSISWIVVLLLLPVVGIVFYIFFGQNVRKEKIISRKSIKQIELINGYYDVLKKRFNIQKLVLADEMESARKLITLLFKNNHALLTNDNKVELFFDGKSTFDAIIEDLQRAKQFIHLEYYILENDEIGSRIVDILMQKAKSGVEVRVIVDDVGSWELKRPFFKKLEASGIAIHSFLQVRFPFFTSRINFRNHRKIIVIDGMIGYTGGINIADRYILGLKEIGGVWRDTHVRIEGSAVNSLQSIFILDWYFVSRKRITERRYFPEHAHSGDKAVQIVSSSPDGDWKTIEQTYFQIIASAKKYVYIQSPYFLPTESISMAFKTAALSGVDIRLIIPGKSDAFITQASSRSYLREILKAGVKVYFYNNGFIHSKMIVADDHVSTIGSANMDYRSFEYNFEVNAVFYDHDIASRLKEVFIADQKLSTEIFQKLWRRRPFSQKLIESIARLLSPLL